jgi:hypothetical protein
VAEAVHSGVLCLLALSMSCASPTDAAFASEAQQQVKVDRPQGAEAGHHPLIEVKFVLRQAPAERDQTPRIELTESPLSANADEFHASMGFACPLTEPGLRKSQCGYMQWLGVQGIPRECERHPGQPR